MMFLIGLGVGLGIAAVVAIWFLVSLARGFRW